MGDEEEEVKLYVYAGDRAEGKQQDVTAGEDPKVLTQTITLLGERHGMGEATFPNGDVHKGAYQDGARNGAGVYTYAAPPPEEGEDPKPPIATYEGKFQKGEKSGVGVLQYASGHKYHGTFVSGKFHGQGTMFYANGDIYTGEWAAGKKQGTGTYVFKETGARVRDGIWEAGILQTGTFTDKFGNAYDGRFAADAAKATYVAGGKFMLASGATDNVPKPTKEELIATVSSFDADGNGVIDAAELKALLMRPGNGVPLGDDMAEAVLMALTELFDKNADGKLSIAEVATALDSNFLY